MEVFIHVEPGRLGGNTRTFAGAPALNPGPLPHRTLHSSGPDGEQGSYDKFSAQLGDGAKLTRDGRGTPR